jgi:predicted HNH restriction endonuclease
MMLEDEEGRMTLREHVRLERSKEVRAGFLEQRRREGRLSCEVCSLSLAKKYGPTFENVVEVHHLSPLWKGTRVTTPDKLALLCPTCHRAVHFHRREPRTLDELRSALKGKRT